jgi:hypothetical protein
LEVFKILDIFFQALVKSTCQDELDAVERIFAKTSFEVRKRFQRQPKILLSFEPIDRKEKSSTACAGTVKYI